MQTVYVSQDTALMQPATYTPVLPVNSHTANTHELTACRRSYSILHYYSPACPFASQKAAMM